MKKILIITIPFLLMVSNPVTGQFSADAGPDQAVCVASIGVDPTYLGGDPTAQGGIPPYTYTWDALYVITIGSFTITMTASDFLNDTTLANPTIISYWETEDFIEFHLTITDSENNICRDTALIKFSQYYILLGYMTFNIQQGDSVYLHYGTNISGGIPPFEYLWHPTHGLADSTSLSFWAKPDHSVAYHVNVTDSAGCSIEGPNYYYINVIPVSVDKIEQDQMEIDIFPNPGQDFIYFKIHGERLGEITIEIYDTMSRLLIVNKETSNEFSIDVNDLKPGMYFYKMSDSEQLIDAGKLFVSR